MRTEDRKNTELIIDDKRKTKRKTNKLERTKQEKEKQCQKLKEG